MGAEGGLRWMPHAEQKVQDIEKAVTLFEMNKKRAERFKELIILYEGFLKDLAEEKKNVNAIERLVADLDAIEKERQIKPKVSKKKEIKKIKRKQIK